MHYKKINAMILLVESYLMLLRRGRAFLEMKCPICVIQNSKLKDHVDIRYTRAHFKSFHLKAEIADMLAQILWEGEKE